MRFLITGLLIGLGSFLAHGNFQIWLQVVSVSLLVLSGLYFLLNIGGSETTLSNEY